MCRDSIGCKPLHSFMIETIEKEKFDSVKLLADMSMQISDAKRRLLDVQKTEVEYLEAREKKATEKIDQIYKDSQDFLDKAQKNYKKVNDFCKVVVGYAESLDSIHATFKELHKDFEKKSALWEKNTTKQNNDIAKMRAVVESDAKMLEDKEKRLKNEEDGLKKLRKHIESQQASLLVAYNKEKELWEKIK